MNVHTLGKNIETNCESQILSDIQTTNFIAVSQLDFTVQTMGQYQKSVIWAISFLGCVKVKKIWH